MLKTMTVWQTLKSYFWWTHPRGSFHYDVMVTLILLFIFGSPFFLNFNDKPVERTPHHSFVQVQPEGSDFIYRIDAAAVKGSTDAEIRADLLRVIGPIAGEAQINRYEATYDTRGNISSYKVWVHRR